MAQIVTAGELLDGQTVLDIECLDRIYLNAYVSVLQSLPGAAGRHRAVRGGRDRGGAGVPAGLGRLPALHQDGGAAATDDSPQLNCFSATLASTPRQPRHESTSSSRTALKIFVADSGKGARRSPRMLGLAVWNGA